MLESILGNVMVVSHTTVILTTKVEFEIRILHQERRQLGSYWADMRNIIFNNPGVSRPG